MSNLPIFVQKAALKVKKYSPEILLGAGLVSMVAAGVTACKATLKAEGIKKEHESRIDTVKEVYEKAQNEELEEEYTEKDYKKDLTVAYAQTGMAYAKLYGPSIALAVTGVVCILSSYNILHKRNVALAGAYTLLEEGFNKYRERVIEELGEEKDLYFKNGVKKEILESVVTDEKGKEKTIKEEALTIDPDTISPYSRIYDDGCNGWTKDPELNLIFLRNQQSYFNDMLKIRGHVFLNEIYDALGFPRTQAGAVVGWVLGNGDDCIDFGIYDVRNRAARDFVNGYERNVLLDFNVDGIIYDKI